MAENDEMPCADLTVAENAPPSGKVDRNGRASLCVLIAAVAIVELLNSLPGFLTGSDWQIPVAFLSCGTMAVLPFILARWRGGRGL